MSEIKDPFLTKEIKVLLVYSYMAKLFYYIFYSRSTFLTRYVGFIFFYLTHLSADLSSFDLSNSPKSK